MFSLLGLNFLSSTTTYLYLNLSLTEASANLKSESIRRILFSPPNSKHHSARCLDGSPPSYHLNRGFGSGKNKWFIFQEGGGWCVDVDECRMRAKSRLGSSLYEDGFD